MAQIKEKVWHSNDPFLSWLRDTKGLGEMTLYLYYTYYKELKQLPNFDQENLEKVIQKRKNNKLVRATINQLLEFLGTQGIQIAFKMPPQPTGKQKKRIIRNYSSEEISTMRKACYGKNTQTGILFDLLYYGALRRSEIVNIKINDFDWYSFFTEENKNFGLKIYGKGKKERFVLIPATIFKDLIGIFLQKQLINPHMDKDQILTILRNNNNKLFKNIYDGWKVWQIINKISKKLFDPPMRPHEIRHYRATELQNRGINIRDIQHYLGHANPQITEIYLHTTAKTSLGNIRDKLND